MTDVQPLRVLFLLNVYPSPIDPLPGVFNETLVRAIAEGHRVRVIAPIPWIDELAARRRGSLMPAERRVVDNGVVIDFPRFWYTPQVLRSCYTAFLWHSIRPTVSRISAAFSPDVVVATWTHPHGEVAVNLARARGAVSVVVVGGSDVQVLSRHPRRGIAIRRVLTAADAVVTGSEDLRRKVLGLGVPDSQVSCIYRGVDRLLFSPGNRLDARRRLGLEERTPTFFFAGNFVSIKGLDVLLESAAQLAAKQPNFRLHLAGDGPLRSALERRVKDLNLTSQVKFLGVVPNIELPDWYRAANVTVLPSYSEGMPTILLESLACGTPFIASAVGGIPEMANPVLDSVVTPGDVASLADAMERSLLPTVGDPPMRRFLPPTPSQSATQLLSLFTELVARRSRAETRARSESGELETRPLTNPVGKLITNIRRTTPADCGDH